MRPPAGGTPAPLHATAPVKRSPGQPSARRHRSETEGRLVLRSLRSRNLRRRGARTAHQTANAQPPTARTRATADRDRAADDRRQSRVDLRAAHLDDLTGVYTRGLGLLTLQHEIDRAHRSGEPFVLAFVDGLKQINDHKGHAAGDTLLQAVAAELRSKLRSYDPIVRVGGDEFVCAFSNTGLEAAAGRVREIQATIEENQVGSSISVGFAELCPGETLEDLTARGDAELYRFKPTT